jgi:hypothetical protein
LYAFEKALKSEARFFSRVAAALLSRIFKDIAGLKGRPRHPLVVQAGPDRRMNHLFRARVFQADDKLEEALCRPDLHLGSPPARLANAGRMNARGISVFYGATKSSAALAEVRPPVGSKVALAKFSIIRPLRLLDLTALDSVRDGGSIFDPTLKERLERVAFLQSLGARMTRSVMPDDEAFDYLPTQAIADFLATENEPSFDGIIFSSAQSKGGRNVVLFQKAARVAELKFPQGTKISADSGFETVDGSETDYSVTETTPMAAEAPKEAPHDLDSVFAFGGLQVFDDFDARDITLKVDPASVEVHHIEWVRVYSSQFSVTRHRYEEADLKF